MRTKILKLSIHKKRLVSLAMDTCVIWFCLWLAFVLRLDSPNYGLNLIADYWRTFLLVPLCTLPCFVRMGLYRSVVRSMGIYFSITIARAAIFSTGLWVLMNFMLHLSAVMPRSVPVMYCVMLIVLLCVSRYVTRSWLLGQPISELLPSLFADRPQQRRLGDGISVAIYGAGEAGMQLMFTLDRGREYHPVAFIDDDDNMHGRMVGRCNVYRPDEIPKMIEATGAQEILLALPSVSPAKRRAIIHSIENCGLSIRTMPSMNEIASGRTTMQEIQDVCIGDVLGREEVQPNLDLMNRNIAGRVVMVTGAGGSIGSELCRQILAVGPKRLVVLDHSEYNLYALEQELAHAINQHGLKVSLIPVLGSVTDPQRLLGIMRLYGVNTIYHAAAYKHVPIVEHNISQGLRNNVLGTLYTAQAAIACGVEQFVLISTDKAVRPTNVMGASKRLAEMVLQALSHKRHVNFYHGALFGDDVYRVANHTRFTMVRFGNVLGSSGSVIPLFQEQIRAGGPITVTHSKITRYFMTIPEASQLVIQAGAMGEGGDVFVLDMGSPVKIVDLAKKMVQLSGMEIKDEGNPDGDIEIHFTGLRPGEKLYEELLIGDNVVTTNHERIYRANEEWIAWESLLTILDQLLETLQNHQYILTRDILLHHVNGFHPDAKVVDWLYRDQHKTAETEDVA